MCAEDAGFVSELGAMLPPDQVVTRPDALVVTVTREIRVGRGSPPSRDVHERIAAGAPRGAG